MQACHRNLNGKKLHVEKRLAPICIVLTVNVLIPAMHVQHRCIASHKEV